MAKKVSLIQWLAWFYASQFFIVVLIGHIPGWTDAQGRLFGLYNVSFLIDAGHFISGVLAVIAALHSTRWSIYYFRFIAMPFGIDALLGVFFSRDLTETGSIFYKGLGPVDFSLPNLLENSPHVILSVVALSIGYGLSRKFKSER